MYKCYKKMEKNVKLLTTQLIETDDPNSIKEGPSISTRSGLTKNNNDIIKLFFG